MKKLNKLQIDPEKLIKNSELLTLKGGYDGGYLRCEGGSGPYCHPTPIPACTDDWIRWYCDAVCQGWTSAICVGG